jgi:hypothetical protein
MINKFRNKDWQYKSKKSNCSAIVKNIHFCHCEERLLRRSNLHKGVIAKKPGDCFSKNRFAVTWLSSYKKRANFCWPLMISSLRISLPPSPWLR